MKTLVLLACALLDAQAESPDAGPAVMEAPPAPTAAVDGGVPPAEAEPVLSDAEMRELEAAMKKDLQQGGANAGPVSGSKYVLGSSEALPRPSQQGPSVYGMPAVASLNADLAFIGDFAFAFFSNDKPLRGGNHDPHKNGFNLQQLELAFGAAVDPYFRADGNIVFQQFGVEIEEVYATTTHLPFGLQARLGQFLTRFGRANATHLHAWDFLEAPMFPVKLWGPEGNRGVAAELSWLAPLPWYVELVFSANEAAGGATARSFLNNTPRWVADPRLLQLNGALKQFFALGDSWSLFLGLSAATGPHYTGRFSSVTISDFLGADTPGRNFLTSTGLTTVGPPQFDGRDHRAEIVGADLYLKFRPIGAALPSFRLPGSPGWAPPFEVAYQIISIQAEAFLRRRQVPGGVLTDHGGFAQVFWRFWSRGALSARVEYGSGVPTAHLGGDPTDPEWTTWRFKGSTALTFWPSEFSRFRVQYSLDRALWRDAPTHALMAAFEFSIGAHGAHAF